MKATGALAIRCKIADHPCSTIKAWIGATHFLCKEFKAVQAKISLHVFAYNLKRIMAILGMCQLRSALVA